MQSRTKVLAATLLLGLTAIGSASAQDKTIKVLGLYPLSGQAQTGEDTLNAIKLAVQVINNANPELEAALRQDRGIAEPRRAKS